MKLMIAPVVACAALCLGAQPDNMGKVLSAQHVQSYADGGMERWQKAMTPGLAHEFLRARFAEGEWETTAKLFMDGVDQPPMEMTWTSEVSHVLGGRFVEDVSTGMMMGQPLESVTMIGYDNVRKLFVITLFDTTTTGVRTLYGNLDREGNVLTFVGAMDEPMTGEVGKPFKYAYTFNDDGTITFKIYEILYGEPFAVIEATSKKAE